jgi:hypothetical protein
MDQTRTLPGNRQYCSVSQQGTAPHTYPMQISPQVGNQRTYAIIGNQTGAPARQTVLAGSSSNAPSAFHL